jgi:hypothetical protein
MESKAMSLAKIAWRGSKNEIQTSAVKTVPIAGTWRFARL